VDHADIYAHFMQRADQEAATLVGDLLKTGMATSPSVSHPRSTVAAMESLIVFDGDDTLWRVELLFDWSTERSR
jgi:hypothetical protein